MEIKHSKIEHSTVHLEAKVPQDQIDHLREHAVDEMISSVTVKGFRQGKAPKSIAENYLDPNKLTNHILSHLFNEIVSEALTKNKYRLLGRPVLNSIDPQKEGGWLIKIDLPLYPEVNLGNYQQALATKAQPKKASKSAKSKKTTATEESKPVEETEATRLDAIYGKLLDSVKVEISPLLIEEEVNFSLERLSTQAKSLNFTLENYLKAVNKTLESVKKEYAQKAEESLKLDVILLEIAKEQKIDTAQDELKEFAKAAGIGESQVSQLKSVMDRRKTIDYLLKI